MRRRFDRHVLKVGGGPARAFIEVLGWRITCSTSSPSGKTEKTSAHQPRLQAAEQQSIPPIKRMLEGSDS
jgi:hypothetical protein